MTNITKQAMLSSFCLFSSLLLFIRSLLLFFKTKQAYLKFFKAFLTVFFLGLTGLLFTVLRIDLSSSSLYIFLCIFLLFTFEFFYAKKQKQRGFIFSFVKIAFFFTFLIMSFVAFSIKSFQNIFLEETLAKIIITGKQRKHPFLNITEHEISLVLREGKMLFHGYIIGDLVGVRAKIIRFHPLLNTLGLRNLCKLDSVFSSYKETPKDAFFPFQSFAITYPSNSLFNFIWKIWENLFLQKKEVFFIRSASYQAVLFPLVDNKEKPFQGLFYLTASESGLSSLSKQKN